MPIVALEGEGAGDTSRWLTQTFTLAATNSTVKMLSGNDELPSYEPKAIAEFLNHWLTDG